LRRIVLDSCVLLAAYNQKDKDHTQAAQGLRHLIAQNIQMAVPACVVLEVAKRLLYDVSPQAMRRATEVMLETLEIFDTTQPSLQEALELIELLNHRTMSLEDAIVINLAQSFGAPVWTHNYRDFASIKNLEFWKPI
jgi:predicted nucleic acid-binding protein